MMMAMMVATIKASDDGDGKRRPDDISPFPNDMSCDHSQRYLSGKSCDTANMQLRRFPSMHVDVAPAPLMFHSFTSAEHYSVTRSFRVFLRRALKSAGPSASPSS